MEILNRVMKNKKSYDFHYPVDVNYVGGFGVRRETIKYRERMGEGTCTFAAFVILIER